MNSDGWGFNINGLIEASGFVQKKAGEYKKAKVNPDPNDVAVKAMLQIRNLLMKSNELKASAKNNTEKDFVFAYFDNIDDALIAGLSQNQDFFTLFLQNDEIKKEILGIFAGEIYKSLRDNE